MDVRSRGLCWRRLPECAACTVLPTRLHEVQRTWAKALAVDGTVQAASGHL
jgi:hypothetical protein